MKKYSLKESGWQLTNKWTGETADVVVTVERGGGRFMKVWQDTGWAERLTGLQGNSVKMLILLVNIAGFQNIVPGPSQTALQFGWKRPLVSRAYRELREANFLYQQDGKYNLNPLFCWKGNQQQYEQAVAEIATHSIKQIMAKNEAQ